MREKNQQERQDSANVIFWPPAIYLVPLAVGLIAHGIYPVRLLAEGLGLFLIGLFFVAIGLVVVLWAERTMHSVGTTPNPFKPTTAIVTSGPYRVTRNPMYLSMVLFYLGLTLMFNALWPLLLFPLVLGVMTYGVIRREERYLERKFGEVYVDYKSRVRRWI
jgi:protein-S-isoprenylcysteine O-methyltransferase Ste14